MKYSYYSGIVILLLCLQACSQETKTNHHRQIIEVNKTSSSNTLFYTGIIQPSKTYVISTPAEGVVVDTPFQYGEVVRQGQLLFKLNSSKFFSDYKTALMQYIKTKSEFNANQAQLTEAQFLHKNQLISDDDLKLKKSNYYTAQLALIQSKDSLDNLMQQLDIKNINLYALTISDIDKITQALHAEDKLQNLLIQAPVDGVILAASKNEEENKKTIKGDAVKSGDVLAVIGDMSGINVRIKVNELIINQLRLGQHVKITGIAFPDDILLGEIKRIDHQGETENGGLPMFGVQVSVFNLTKSQQNYIHAGMSAKVEIKIEDDPKIMIPMAAISEKEGIAYVETYNGKTDKQQMVAVKTGKTSIDSIAILSGLKIGDKIVVPN